MLSSSGGIPGSVLSIVHHVERSGPVVDASSFKDLQHPSLNESLKGHNALSFKLVRIVSDFTQQLSQIHEQHSNELQTLVGNFRKRNAELRKERAPCSSSLFQVWETLLQEVEIDSQAHSELSGSLGRQVARPLLEKTFCRKIQSRKIFTHRESFETVLSKTEALLSNAYRDYCDACLAHAEQGTSTTMSAYFDAHNAYVMQLRGTNAMLKEYHSEILPALLQELDEIYIDLCNTLSDSILQSADLVANRTQETNRRYETLTSLCKNVSGTQDLRDLVRSMTVPQPPNQRHAFTPPMVPEGADINLEKSHVPILKDEIISDRTSAPACRNRQEGVRKEIGVLESEMKQIQDSLDTLIRMQQRSLESNLFNKANELQEEISMKKFDVRVAQLHLAALRAQVVWDNTRGGSDSASSGWSSLASGGAATAAGAAGGDSSKENSDKALRDRNKAAMASSNNNNPTMKSKWMKALKSLKTPQGSSSSPSKEPENSYTSSSNSSSDQMKSEKKNQMFLAVTAIMMMRKNGGKDKDKQGLESFSLYQDHIFQEYTYKKITPCDICSQVLRGHTKQGLRCRLCKMNVHMDCKEKVSKCLPKTRLLRRQKSASELETVRINLQAATEAANKDYEEDDKRSAGDMSQSSSSLRAGAQQPDEPDLIYQVLKQATDMKKPSGGGSQSTIYSAGVGHTENNLASASSAAATSQHRRSNPTVNVVAGSTTAVAGSGSGSNTPGGAAQALINQSSSGRRRTATSAAEKRRDSYTSYKSVSADTGQGSTKTPPLLANFPLPPAKPRCISNPETVQTPHSPRRRKLDLRMKSFSLDSPESTEHAQRRRFAHGTNSSSHSQYWKLSYYASVDEDDVPGGPRMVASSSGSLTDSHIGNAPPPLPSHSHYQRYHMHVSANNPPTHHPTAYSSGMVHSKSATVNPSCYYNGGSSGGATNAQAMRRSQTPPSTLLAAAAATSSSSAHIENFYPANNGHHQQPSNQLPSPSYSSLNHFAPSSPVHNRRALLSTRNVRMSSVELPDENDKSLSSASTSPCPSPKPHRLLPPNLYVVLYMFKARHPDELDLQAGFKVTVTDTTDPDWWQGKCFGRIGYFPSKYVTKLQSGEKPLQVTHNLQVTDGAENGLKLLRDQIVIQIGDELDGMVTIRNGDNKQGICPLKYLQEV